MKSKVKESLNTVVRRLKAGDFGPIVAMTMIQLPEDAPARKWSLLNRVLAVAQSGTLDCRGYRQWQAAGRHRGHEAEHHETS